MDLIPRLWIVNGILKLREALRFVEIGADLWQIFKDPRGCFKCGKKQSPAGVPYAARADRRDPVEPFRRAPRNGVALFRGVRTLGRDLWALIATGVRRHITLSRARGPLRSRGPLIAPLIAGARLAMSRPGFGVTRFIGPLTCAGLAFGDARLVRIETCFDQPRDDGKPPQCRVVEIAERDAQPVNLGERNLAGVECLRDTEALLEEPVRVLARAKQGGLDRPCFAG